MAQDDVVEDLDLEQLPSPDQVAGYPDVGLAGRRIAAGVVVGEDDGRGALGDGDGEHLPGMDQDLVQQALGDVLDGDEAASGVQAEDLEVLDGVEPVGFAEDVRNPFRGVQHWGLTVGLLGEALGEEKCGPDGGRPGTANALQLLEFIEGRPRDGREPTEALHERLGGAGPAEGGEQFRVRCVFNRLHGYLREGQAPDAHLTWEVCRGGLKVCASLPRGRAKPRGFPSPHHPAGRGESPS